VKEVLYTFMGVLSPGRRRLDSPAHCRHGCAQTKRYDTDIFLEKSIL